MADGYAFPRRPCGLAAQARRASRRRAATAGLIDGMPSCYGVGGVASNSNTGNSPGCLGEAAEAQMRQRSTGAQLSRLKFAASRLSRSYEKPELRMLCGVR